MNYKTYIKMHEILGTVAEYIILTMLIALAAGVILHSEIALYIFIAGCIAMVTMLVVGDLYRNLRWANKAIRRNFKRWRTQV